MRAAILIFSFVFAIPALVCALGTSTLDSLRVAFSKSGEGLNQIRAGMPLTSELLRINPQESLDLSKHLSVKLDSLQRAGSLPDSTLLKYRMNLFQAMGSAYSLIGDVDNELKMRMKKLEISQQSKNMFDVASSLEGIGNIYYTQGHYEEAVDYFRRALDIATQAGNTYYVALELGNIGSAIEKIYPDSTLWYYHRSLDEMEKPGMSDREGAMGWMLQNIGEVFENKGALDSAFSYYNRSLAIRQSINHLNGVYNVQIAIAGLHLKQNKLKEALKHINSAIAIAEENGFRQNLYEGYALRSEIHNKLGRYKEALEDQLHATAERDSTVSERNTKQVVQQTMKYEYGRKMLADSLEFSHKEAVLKERTQKQRIGLFAAAGGLILVITLAYSIFKGKKRSDELLLNILPEETAHELKKKGHADAKLIDEVTVMFTDFKNFTQASENLSPEELVAEIHYCYSAFDRIISKHNLEKIKTIGDSYMCAGGLPLPNTTHAEDTVHAALEICEFMNLEKEKRKTEGKPFFEIRIGCHTGPVVSGIVGIKKFAYDIWGDTVNIASRMESSGEAGKINISESTYEFVKDKFICEHRGKIQAKNKGEIEMYFVQPML